MMNNPEKIKQVWLIGIGGIGMSALARYFHHRGMPVAGYDRTPSLVTDALKKEGIEVFFDGDPELIAPVYRSKEDTLVIYTPAVEASQRQLTWFRERHFEVLKRAQVLGLISSGSQSICIAGTHGKTTISTMVAHLFKRSRIGCTAFLGGISKNYGTNFWWDEASPFVVLEADEFDRSFLWLNPQSALISSTDADHLDVYGDKEKVEAAFSDFAQRVSGDGFLLLKEGVAIREGGQQGVKVFTYSLQSPASDFYASGIKLANDLYGFDLVTPQGLIENLTLGVPGLLNIENAVGAMALALLNGVTVEEIRAALPSFEGIARRFDIHVHSPEMVYIDDYAHHPEEIHATLESVRAMYPNHKVTGIFQPHLYSRTRDFAEAFAASLSRLDALILLDIYPAREFPIPGVDAQMIGEQIKDIPVAMPPKKI
ncbi:UDP-N-acetylmuramate--L-alanine ligase [Geofilum rubicundum]|uniref:UDP-N-acetylmuramate--L-alanine ligase n=1 Tax=Geofilum rubicundum JCM 15548 TaxID=1236989 RepID=A0A0E9M0U5_9BACT|nr:UDP-N-acetylmuramate--L-alanine ligase [Geofilum rubicundum]GAO30991.1 UDP-N-acetylmuramate-alanine ligase [Geofilum rubicundum JCM 15548]